MNLYQHAKNQLIPSELILEIQSILDLRNLIGQTHIFIFYWSISQEQHFSKNIGFVQEHRKYHKFSL